MSDDILVLNDENGDEVELELLDVVDYNGGQYAVLLPVDESEEEVTILRITGDEQYETVPDDETLFAVYEIFQQHFAQDETIRFE